MSSYYAIIGAVVAGLGLFFIGVRLIGGSLRQMAGRRFRVILSRLTYYKSVSALLGIISGAITQSTSAVTFIMTGMISSGLMTTKRAMPLVLWSNAGNSLLVFLAVIDFHLMVLYLLGLVGFLYYLDLDKSKLVGPFVGTLLGASLLLFGLDTLKSNMTLLQSLDWFDDFMGIANHSQFFGLIGAAGFSFIAQSAATISAIAIAVANAGFLERDSVLMIIYGTNLGTGVTTWVMASKLTGAPKQLAIFQVIFKFTCLILFVGLFYIEKYFHVPLVRSLLDLITTNIVMQLAIAYLLFQIVGALLFSFFMGFIHRFLSKRYPETIEERLGKPKYIKDNSLLVPEVAIGLIESEELRVLNRLPHYLDELRNEPEKKYPTAFLHIGTQNLIKEVSSYITELMEHDLPNSLMNKFINLHLRAELMANLEDTISELVLPLEKTFFSNPLSILLLNISESLHVLLLTLCDVVQDGSIIDVELLNKMTEDRGELMQVIHREMRQYSPRLSFEEQQVLEFVTTRFERIIWMIRYFNRLIEKSRQETE